MPLITYDTPEPDGPQHVVYTDGGLHTSTGPVKNKNFGGTMGIGYVIHQGDSEVCRVGALLGEGTNNKAEYWALICALRHCHRMLVRRVAVYSDSELMVRQVNGQYRAGDALKPFCQEAKALFSLFVDWSLSHVPREQNRLADSLAAAGGPADDMPADHPVEGRRAIGNAQAALVRWWGLHKKEAAGQKLPRLVSRIFPELDPENIKQVLEGRSYKDVTTTDLRQYGLDVGDQDPLASPIRLGKDRQDGLD